MKLKFNTKTAILLTVGMSFAISSCKKMVDVEPKTTVGIANMYRNVFDADAAVIGVYGKVMKMAKMESPAAHQMKGRSSMC